LEPAFLEPRPGYSRRRGDRSASGAIVCYQRFLGLSSRLVGDLLCESIHGRLSFGCPRIATWLPLPSCGGSTRITYEDVCMVWAPPIRNWVSFVDRPSMPPWQSRLGHERMIRRCAGSLRTHLLGGRASRPLSGAVRQILLGPAVKIGDNRGRDRAGAYGPGGDVRKRGGPAQVPAKLRR